MKKSILISFVALFVSLLPISSVLAQSYSGTTVSAESDGKTYKVVANAGDTVTLLDIGSGSGKISVTFSANINGSIVVEESATKPAGAASEAPGSVNLYFNVTLNSLTNADISGAKWTFAVTKDWLNSKDVSSGNVFLHHYGSSWTRLTTREISSDSTSHTFEADVSDFSPFAVTAVPGLSNTGSPYMLGAILAVSILAVITGSFILSRKQPA